MKEQAMTILKETNAILEGHFLLSSGRHAQTYCQMAKLLQYPQQASHVLQELLPKLQSLEIDIIVGPAIGGIIVAYELGRLLNKKAIFTEREQGVMTLRRGFEIFENANCLIAEDVVTTGKSSKETADVITKLGGNVVGIASIIDRTTQPIFCPVYSAISLDLQTFDAVNCPICKKNTLPLVKPGSRKLPIV